MCPFTVRVPQRCCLAGFLGSLVTGAITSPRRVRCTIGFLLTGWICLPRSTHTPFNPLFRQGAAVSLLRHHITRCGSNGILTVSAIGLAFRLILRTRLTPGRLTLPGKPWSYSGRESHPPYRYLFLHLLYPPLQDNLRTPFDDVGMLPYRYFYNCYPAPSVSALYPIIIHARTLD